MSFRSTSPKSSSGSSSGSADESQDTASGRARTTAGRRRIQTVAVGMVPVIALAALLAVPSVPGTDIDLSVPYAAEGEGPTYDTLGEVNGTPVVDITGTQADLEETSGQLNMTTVAVRTKLSLAEAMRRWLATDDTLVPVEQVLPSDSTPE
ncbi:MAG: hypothetical protein ACTHV5_02095, partial [Candidatus Corynebacterium faecigallinarum]